MFLKNCDAKLLQNILNFVYNKGFASSKNPGVVIVFELLREKSYKNTVEWLEKTGV